MRQLVDLELVNQGFQTDLGWLAHNGHVSISAQQGKKGCRKNGPRIFDAPRAGGVPFAGRLSRKVAEACLVLGQILAVLGRARTVSDAK